MSLDAPPSGLQIWGDIRCPWCWVGFRRSYAAAAQVGVDEPFRHRSFLLEPNGPPGTRTTIAEAAVSSWGMSGSDWDHRSERIRHAGHAEGIEINIDSARQVDSRDAHRFLKVAVDQGVEARLAWEGVFDAHLRRNEDVEDHEVLVGVGVGLGLDPGTARAALAAGTFAEEVESDHRAAVARGVTTVPAFIGHGRSLSGAVRTDELARLLQPLAGANR